MRCALGAIALLWSSTALAGGIGLMGTGGLHSQPVYFYDGPGADAQQYRQTQQIATFGTGIELILGDRDDRWVGFFRGYWQGESPETDPATRTQLVDPGDVVANWREEVRHTGVGSVGVQWGYWGRPEGFQLTAVAAIGSGFLATDHQEFLLAELGAGAAYRINRSVQIVGNAAYQLRYRKIYVHGPTAYVSLRYLFD